jgi:hypothetical protein
VRHRQQTLPKYFNDSSNTLYPTPLIIMHKLYEKKMWIVHAKWIKCNRDKTIFTTKTGGLHNGPINLTLIETKQWRVKDVLLMQKITFQVLFNPTRCILVGERVSEWVGTKIKKKVIRVKTRKEYNRGGKRVGEENDGSDWWVTVTAK